MLLNKDRKWFAKMLNINPVVTVNVSIGMASFKTSLLDIGAILVKDSLFTSEKRLRTYTSKEEAAAGMITDGFDASTEAYRATQKYFSATPAPKKLLVSCYPTSESPVDAFDALMAVTTDFYGIALADVRTDNELILLHEHLIMNKCTKMLFLSVRGTASSAVASNSLSSKLYNAKARRAMGIYCSSVSDASALMGTAMGYASKYADTGFSICYKKLTNMLPSSLTSTQVNAMKEVNLNVAIEHKLNEGARLEYGETYSGLRFDEALFIDRIALEIQQSIYNLIAGSETKLPQTDSTSSLLAGEVIRILDKYYNMGVLADNVWRGPAIGNVNTGDIVEHGYAVFVDSYNEQSNADRAAHKAMPITVLICLSGSVESIMINLDIQT